MSGRRGFGYVRRLPSGRYQASYLGPDRQRHNAPVTFDTRDTAEGWLSLQRADILRNKWLPEVSQKEPEHVTAPVTLRAYSETWLAGRDLSPSTRRLYTITLDRQILPKLGARPLGDITPVMVDRRRGRTGPRRALVRGHDLAPVVRQLAAQCVPRRIGRGSHDTSHAS